MSEKDRLNTAMPPPDPAVLAFKKELETFLNDKMRGGTNPTVAMLAMGMVMGGICSASARTIAFMRDKMSKKEAENEKAKEAGPG